MTSTPVLRDGVEVFIYPCDKKYTHILFLFFSSRRRLKIQCENSLIPLLKAFSTTQTLAESLDIANLNYSYKVQKFIEFLGSEGIIMIDDPLNSLILPSEYLERYKRQLYFLYDIVKSSEEVIKIQEKIFRAKIAIFGLGAIGSNILLQLCMLGFRNFNLIDYSNIEINDIARTPYPIDKELSIPKVQSARNLVEKFAYKPVINTFSASITTKTELDPFLENIDFIINSTDEPYVGYTNIFLSRYAVKHRLPMIAAGGFDAHLASLGELLIPYLTPCADCYATFFHDALKDWKPINHPTKERRGWFGGLPTLTTFSASSSVLDILSYFMKDSYKMSPNAGRGEFLFHNYTIDTFNVERDINCITCGIDKNVSI